MLDHHLVWLYHDTRHARTSPVEQLQGHETLPKTEDAEWLASPAQRSSGS